MRAEITGRLELLAELGEALARRRDDLMAAQGQDMGAPWITTGREVDLAVAHLKTMAEEAPDVEGKSPYGTVAAIFPYDAPPLMLARVGGAALLGGNRFRFSCSSQTPSAARLLQEVVAPFPGIEGITGLDNREFGRRCVQDPEVRVLFISGGGAVGDIYAREARHFDKLFFAGPSGLPPVIFFKDADVEKAAHFTVRRAFLNGGQYCTTLKRAYIHQDIFAPVQQRVLEEMAAIRVGDPRDPETWIGPIKVERTRQLLDRALAALQEPHFLAPFQRQGEWQGPFLMETAAAPDVELFGPFLALVPAQSGGAAVATVLRSRYPFQVTWFGSPPPGAKEALTKKFGMAYDNPDFLFAPMRMPFGGKGDSGWILENRNGGVRKRDGAFIYSAELVKDV